MLEGTLTLTLQSEDDILLAAQIIQQRRLVADKRIRKHADDDSMRSTVERKLRLTSAEVLAHLKTNFQGSPFSRAQANDEVAKIAGYSCSKTGRILTSAIGAGELQRLKTGLYSFIPRDKVQDIVSIKPKRKVSEKRLSVLKTLENPLLYYNFVRKMDELNPGIFDEQLIDRKLEPDEALKDLKRKHPDLHIYEPKELNFQQDVRDYLSNLGIDIANVQDLVIARMDSENPFTEDELMSFAHAQHVAIKDLPPSLT